MIAGRIAQSALVGTLCLGLGAGCNAVTGAGDLMVAGGSSGSGGAGTGGSIGTGTKPTECVYPTTGFGNGVGNVVPPHRQWDGFPEGSKAGVATDAVPVLLDDYFDCDGSRGINAILLDESAVWCGACELAATDINNKLKTSWSTLGIKVITLMIDDVDTETPATTATALKWKTTFHLDSSAVVADPQFTFIPPNASSIGLPLELIVDPRTMTIVASEEGYSGDYSELVALAKKNAAP